MGGVARSKAAGRRVLGIVTGGLVVSVVMVIAAASPAWAACHSFTVSASPATAGEGSTVTVTVTRDAGIEPSSIEVSTVDETAIGSSDYEPVATTVSFDTGTQQTLSIAVLDDTEPESAETFRVHLANPGGCSIQPDFVIGPDAVVTIPENDEAASSPTTTQPGQAPSDEGDTGQSTPTTTQASAPSGGVDAGLGGTSTSSSTGSSVLGFVFSGAGLLVLAGTGAVVARNRLTRS